MTAPKRTSRPRQRLRLFLLGLVLIAFVFAVALATSSWWLPRAARGLLAREGITFARVETLGYGRFVLHDVSFKTPAISVTATRVETDSPPVWLARGLFARPGPVVIKTWRAEINDAPSSPSTPSTVEGWPDLQNRLGDALATLEKWLPQARATNGTLTRGNQTFAIASLDWHAHDGRLDAAGITAFDHVASAQLRWDTASRQLTFNAATADEQWSVSLKSHDNAVTGELRAWKQPVALRAVFPDRGWIPDEAEITAADLTIPGASVGLGQLYGALPGQARILWKNAGFTYRIRAEGEPLAGESVPPLSFDLSGAGDASSIRIQNFDIDFPGTTVRLLAPIVVDRDAQVRSGPSEFSLSSDLEKIPGLENVRGKIEGRVRVHAGEDTPRLTAQLDASAISAPGLELKSAHVEAGQVGPLLTLNESRLDFADGSHASLKGAWHWSEKKLSDVRLEADVKPAAFSRWLPSSMTFTRFIVSAKAAGAWPAVEHSGELSLEGFAAGTPKPLAATGTWQGRGLVAETIDLTVKTGDSRATLHGRLASNEATLESAEIALPENPPLQLARPATIGWSPSLRIQKLDFSGGTARIAVAWSTLEARRARVEIADFPSTALRDFLPSAWPPWKLGALTLDGAWPEGPFEGSLQLEGEVEIADGRPAGIELAARTRATQISIERFLIDDPTGPVLTVRGSVPVVLTPATAPFWRFEPSGRWSLTAATTPASPFWTAQAAASGVRLQSPRLSARIEGLATKPDARIDLQAAEAAFDRLRLPPLSQLEARLVLDAGRIALERFSVLVSGQRVTASGHAHIRPEQWSQLAANPRVLWSGDAEATVALPAIDLSAFATLLPDAFAPTGTLNGELTFKAAGEIDGALKIEDVSTHPISPFGSFSDISGELVFTGRKARLNSLRALASGQPVTLGGDVSFPPEGDPAFDIELKGHNLPLARQTGLLIRGDLDLRVKTAGDGSTTLGGKVNLHDGLFLRDVRSLIPTRGGSPASRPPYFSVERAPFRDWRLAVKVGGSRFIKLRTPLFNGVASGDFDLGGTLYEPLAIGQVVFDEGNILLPFASLRLKNAAVRLTRADPYSPQIALVAESRTLGYDVRMEISGSVTEPAVVFSSSPPLSSEQVLLMVMAGETPRSDISYTGAQRAQRIGTYLGKSLISGIFGGGQGAERLTITSGENVTDRGEETYSVEYKLNDKWSVVGERDEFDDYNAGFKRRVFAPKKEASDAAQNP